VRYGEREIYLIGASGAGKSSLIAAGLIPMLTRRTSGLPCFHIRTLRPREQPLQWLTEALEADLSTPVATVERAPRTA